MPSLQARAARTAWPLAAAPDGWRIAAAAQPLPSPTEPSMTNDETPKDAEGAQDAGAEAGSDDALVSNLQVQLAFDNGRLEVSRSEEHTSELKSLMRMTYAVFC